MVVALILLQNMLNSASILTLTVALKVIASSDHQNNIIIRICIIRNIKKEVLHKIIGILFTEIHFLVSRAAAILKIAIYDRSGGRPSRRPGEFEKV